jgi:glutaredoxin-like protein
MTLLSAEEQSEIRKLFEQLAGEVKLTYFTQRESPLYIPGQDCGTCKDTRMLLEEVTALSDKLHLEVHEFVADSDIARQHGIQRIPALVISSDTVKGKVRYFGMPSGYEFPVLLGALVDASCGKTSLSAETETALQNVSSDVHIQVFVTPTCPYCAPLARLAHRMAIENSHIVADVVEVTEFPPLVQQYAVRGVPKTVINDTVEFVGALPEQQFVEHVQRAASPVGS